MSTFLACCHVGQGRARPVIRRAASGRPRQEGSLRPASAPPRPAAPRRAARCRCGRPTGVAMSSTPAPAASSAARAAAKPAGAAPSRRPVPTSRTSKSAARSRNGAEVRQPGPGHRPLRQQRQRPAVHRAGHPEAARRRSRRSAAAPSKLTSVVRTARSGLRPCRTGCRPRSSGFDQSRLTPSQSTMALATQIEE